MQNQSDFMNLLVPFNRKVIPLCYPMDPALPLEYLAPDQENEWTGQHI